MVKYYVDKKNGSDKNEGFQATPFQSINKAAAVAVAGDTVVVHEGEYRERVNPKNSGLSNKRRITYKAAEGEKVIIKGSERISDWEKVEGNIWRKEISNDFFGDYNPYKEKVFGDWLLEGTEKHLGNVYLNGMSFYEVDNYNDLFNNEIQTEVLDNWTNKVVPVLNQEQTKYKWFTEMDEKNTRIYANFCNTNPNTELVEINVRKYVFYPENTNINYITVEGFEMSQAATPWTPPTADQPGLIGAHWSKGWIIQNNIVHDSKCSGISIGKEISTGDNFSSRRKDKPGYQYQLESVFTALYSGWKKENIGSHIIRDNIIYNCGQNAIVGHLGCVFSEIYNNDIYNIGIKREFFGHEIAGIKLHAPIDTQIYKNRIRNCSLGIWLDWQAQGSRISKNIFYNNTRDLFVEVSSGPYLVDNNIITADYAIDNHAQGGAYINNIIMGKMVVREMLNRATPYHLPHSTLVSGFAPVYTGDDRFYNNIFVNETNVEEVGTNYFNDYTTSLEEYIENVNKASGRTLDHEAFHQTKQPVYVNRNAYFNDAKAFSKEEDNYINKEFNPHIKLVEEDNKVFLYCNIPEDFLNFLGEVHTTDSLPKVLIVDADFEEPDGSKLNLKTDLLNNKRSDKTVLGPISSLQKGENKISVWDEKQTN